MNKIGNKNGIILDLLISAAHAGFYPAADVKVYNLFLWLIFILRIGFILPIICYIYMTLYGLKRHSYVF